MNVTRECAAEPTSRCRPESSGRRRSTSTVSRSVRAPTSAGRERRARLLARAPPGGRLGFWRWTSIVFGVAGTYRQNDVVDVIYEAADGRRAVASNLPVEPGWSVRGSSSASSPALPRFSTTHHASVRSITNSISGSECSGAIETGRRAWRLVLGESRPHLQGAVRIRAAEELVEVLVVTVHLCDCAHAFVHLAEERLAAREPLLARIHSRRLAPGRNRDGAQPRRACSFLSCPGASFQAQLPVDFPGVHPGFAAELEHVLERDHRERGGRRRAPARSAARLPAPKVAAERVGVVRRRVDHDLVLAVVLEPVRAVRPALEGPEHDHPGKPSRSRSACTSGVIRPRSSAITGSCRAGLGRLEDGGARPAATVRRARPALFGIAQNSAKPRKWSIRVRSKSASVRRSRSIHQR